MTSPRAQPSSPTRQRLATSGMVRVMPTVAAIPRRQAVALTEQESQWADRVAQRLHGDLARLVDQLPEAARGGSGMARHLGLVRNTCQRVSAFLSEAPSAQSLARLPGVRGLEQFIDSLADRDTPRDQVQTARASVGQFAQLIVSIAGSHAKLCDRLSARTETRDQASGPGTLQARAALTAAAVEVTGRSCQTLVSLQAFRQAPTPGHLTWALASGLIGARMSPHGMPMTLATGNTEHWDKPPTRQAPQDDPILLEEFTTTPLPTVTTRGSEGNRVQVIDPANLEHEAVFDVVTMRPLMDVPPLSPTQPGLTQVWCLINSPAEALIFDIYLHRAMERDYRPAIDALLRYPGTTAPDEDKWLTRLPDQPTLTLLGEGLARAGSPDWARHHELTEAFFDRIGWAGEEFVGFRCAVRYPIWRAGYCMSFSYAGRG